MAGKLYLAFVLLAAVYLGAQASLDRYGPFAAGKEGFKERCFVRYALMNEIIRFTSETFVDELKSDLAQIEASFEPREFQQFGTCFRFPECLKLNHQAYRHEDFGGSRFDDAKCARYSKFGMWCEVLNKNSNSNKEQLQAIERWVCQVRDDNRMNVEDKIHQCRPKIVDAAEDAAVSEFDELIAHSEDDLERAKQVLVEEIAAESAQKAAHDAKVAEEAFRRMRAELFAGVPQFKVCWAQGEAQEVNERIPRMPHREPEIPAKVAGAKREQKKKNMFRKLLHF